MWSSWNRLLFGIALSPGARNGIAFLTGSRQRYDPNIMILEPVIVKTSSISGIRIACAVNTTFSGHDGCPSIISADIGYGRFQAHTIHFVSCVDMAPIEILSVEEGAKVLLRWEKDGPTDEEQDEFLATALAQLTDGEKIQAFADNISQVAELAKEIDKTFVDVEKILWLLVWVVWPIGLPLVQKWISFKERWRVCLRSSCGIAASTAEILKRFDEIYLSKVENISTEQDRLEAIQLLGSLKVELEKNDQSAVMSAQFLELKRDVYAFVHQFNTSATSTAIEPLLKDIETLDQQIKFAQAAFVNVGSSFLEALGLGASASPLVASLQSQRQKKAESLRDIHIAMAGINKLVVPQVQGEQITMPDIDLMMERLVIFAEIWSSVRNQTVQFSGHIQGGLSAATNARFKSEIKVARAACTPLREGLLEYKRQLESWI